MPETKQKITPCLWFDTQAEEAANFYISVFKNSRIKHVSRYGKAGREVHGKEAGSVMVVEFEIDGQTFTALNGGPHFKFNEAVSFQVSCATQAEIDHFWSRLSQGGQESRCGWLKDKYGVSWQIVPSVLPQMMTSADGATADRVMNAVLTMKKFDLDALNRAYAGRGREAAEAADRRGKLFGSNCCFRRVPDDGASATRSHSPCGPPPPGGTRGRTPPPPSPAPRSDR